MEYKELLIAVKKLAELDKIALQECTRVVDSIISTGYMDVNSIEHVFDRMLDIMFISEEELGIPYGKLLDYVRSLDKDSAESYETFFHEKFQDDPHEAEKRGKTQGGR